MTHDLFFPIRYRLSRCAASFHTSSLNAVLAGAVLLTGLVVTGCGAEGAPDERAAVQKKHSDEEHGGEHGGHNEHEEGGTRELTLSRAQLASLEIETLAVEEASVGTTLELPGRVVPVPDQEALVTSLIDGRIERVLVNEGDRVQAGEPVATVTGPVLGDYLAELRHSRADLERQKRLTARGMGVRRSLVEAQTAHTAARQHLRALGFASDEIETLAAGDEVMGGMPLRAPIGGVVLKRTATVGGPVAPGQVLLHIIRLSPIWVEADAYEKDLDLLRKGAAARVRTTTAPNQTHQGTVRQILPQVHRERRVATLQIQLPNDDKRLKPGMFAAADVLTAGDEQPALPVAAIRTDGGQSYVIVAENDSTFRRIDVAASAGEAGYVGVPELPLGTQVVTAGAFQIHSAMTGVEAGHAH